MTLRIGVIGTGAIGRDHARRINQVLSGARITALSDVNLDSARAIQADIAPEAPIAGTGLRVVDAWRAHADFGSDAEVVEIEGAA